MNSYTIFVYFYVNKQPSLLQAYVEAKPDVETCQVGQFLSLTCLYFVTDLLNFAKITKLFFFQISTSSGFCVYFDSFRIFSKFETLRGQND